MRVMVMEQTKVPRAHAISAIIDDHDASGFVGLLDDKAAEVGGGGRKGSGKLPGNRSPRRYLAETSFQLSI